MIYKEKFMADHADMPPEEAEELMLATCPDAWLYRERRDCPAALGKLNGCVECWEQEMGGDRA